jgi:tetratricopeptide (TPR) repeat protein
MVPSWLRQLSVQELILAEGGADWAFKHAITQEVAYNLLPFAHRRDLHGRVAKWYAGSDEAPWPTLAWHWERAGEADEALGALEHAAIGAAREHANTEVLLFLDRARALAIDLPQPAARHAVWDSMAGTARLKLASYPESRAHFRSALARLGSGVPSSRVRLALDLLLGCGRLAVDVLLGVKRPEAAPVRARFRAVAEAHQGLAEVEFFSLDLLGLLHADVHAILAAARAGEPREIAIACASGAIGAGLGGLHALGWRWNAEALEAARQSGHTPTLAYVNLLSAVFTSGLGCLDAAAAANAEATRLFRQLGDGFRASSSLCGEAFNRLARGRFAEAREAVGQARLLAPRHGALQVRVWCATVDVLLAGVSRGPAGGDGSALPAAVDALDALLLEEPHHAERILALGALAGGRRALGHEAAALAAAREAVRLAVLAPPTNWFQLWSLADAVGVIVASAAVPDREAGRAVGTLLAFARMCPVAEPRAALAQSALATRRGRPAKAQRYATAALTRATTLGMPWELALAQLAAGEPGGTAAMLTLRAAESTPWQAT